MKKRKTVGFFVHQLEDDYAALILKGAVVAAEDLDINLVIFPGKLLEGQYYDHEYTTYDYQHNVLYEYASEKTLDGLVVSAGTIGTFVSDEYMMSFLGKYNLPIITIERKIGNYPCLRFNSDGIYDIVNHLISEHGCKKIAFVSGPKDNEDGKQRLCAYKSALRDNGMEIDENMIEYGNFSEYSVEVVDELLDRCKEQPDAICFANDTMCVGAYKALRRRGIEPGRDILITGYDDSPVAIALNPMLTTVKASADILGYNAIEAIYNIISNKNFAEASLKSSVVFRNSCGCTTDAMISGEELVRMSDGISDDDVAAFFVDKFIPGKFGINRNMFRTETTELIRMIFDICSGQRNANENAVNDKLDRLLRNGILDEIHYDEFIGITDTAQKFIKTKYPEINLADLFVRLYRTTLDYLMQTSHTLAAEQTSANFFISNISKDMMSYAYDEDKCFYSILHKLTKIKIRSSFLYIYPEPINNVASDEWKMPDNLILTGYHIDEDAVILPQNERSIPWTDCIENKYTSDKAKTVVLSVLYSNETQYGILICDIERRSFPYIYSITPQIGTAIMLTSMVKYLRGSLDAANDTNIKLNEMSMCDELTGVYNRRGFYKYANEEIQNPRNEGMTGILIFADVDNLKKINDRLGHDDGDYAICTAAGYLKNGLRHSDIVARTGGDEFSALIVTTSPDMSDRIFDKIKQMAEKHNKQSSKSYNVTVSIGIHTFTCGKNICIQDYMDLADNALYEDKKNKNKNIWKE